MFPSYLILVYFTTTLLNVNAFPFNNTIEWVPAVHNQVLLLKQIPVGIEKGYPLFLCRTRLAGTTMPGKLNIFNGLIFCHIGYRGEEYKSYDFEVLVTYPESVSWKIYKGRTNENMIPSGIVNGEQSYICRAEVDDNLIPGRLSTNERTCHVAYAGLEYVSSDGIEYLGRNFLGITLNTEIIS